MLKCGVSVGNVLGREDKNLFLQTEGIIKALYLQTYLEINTP